MLLDMAIFWTLCIQSVWLVLLIIPMPVRLRGILLRSVATSRLGARLDLIKYARGVLTVVWLLAAREYHLVTRIHQVSEGNPAAVEVEQLHSQHRFYLSSFCVVLMLVAHRHYTVLHDVYSLHEKNAILRDEIAEVREFCREYTSRERRNDERETERAEWAARQELHRRASEAALRRRSSPARGGAAPMSGGTSSAPEARRGASDGASSPDGFGPPDDMTPWRAGQLLVSHWVSCILVALSLEKHEHEDRVPDGVEELD